MMLIVTVLFPLLLIAGVIALSSSAALRRIFTPVPSLALLWVVLDSGLMTESLGFLSASVVAAPLIFLLNLAALYALEKGHLVRVRRLLKAALGLGIGFFILGVSAYYDSPDRHSPMSADGLILMTAPALALLVCPTLAFWALRQLRMEHVSYTRKIILWQNRCLGAIVVVLLFFALFIMGMAGGYRI